MHLILDLGDAGQLLLPCVVKRPVRAGLKLSHVLPHPGSRRNAARAHTRVVAETSLVEVRVVERLCYRDPLVGVQGQHLAEQVHRLVCARGRERVERADGGLLGRAGGHVPLGGLAGVAHVGGVGRAQEVGDHLQLLDGTLGLEEDSPTQQLAENAADRPQVDGVGVVLGAHQDLGRPVVLRYNLLGHVAPSVVFLNPSESIVANLENTIRVNEQVPRLDVSVDDFCCMKVLDPSQDLVEKDFDVVG